LALVCQRSQEVKLDQICEYDISTRQAQLSQRDRVMLRVIEYFAKSLKITQGH